MHFKVFKIIMFHFKNVNIDISTDDSSRSGASSGLGLVAADKRVLACIGGISGSCSAVADVGSDKWLLWWIGKRLAVADV